MKKLLIALFLVSINFPSFAAGSSSGTVGMMLINASNILMFTVGTQVTPAGCSTVANQWAVSLETNQGKSMYALLLTALSQGTTLTVAGTGACTAWPDRETPKYIFG